jgi:hypothetical protein
MVGVYADEISRGTTSRRGGLISTSPLAAVRWEKKQDQTALSMASLDNQATLR